MRKNFLQIVLVLIQIISSLVFFVASWKADRALDKSGIGDIERFTYWNALAGNYIKLFFLAWVITLFIAIIIHVKKHGFINILKTKLPYYVILPPLAILAFCIISIL
jgi:glycosyltransferase involved in cell wall biosynthesis